MDTSPNLLLPYLMPSQAQKHVTHNEAIRSLDALVGTAVASRVLSAPPGSPSDGARYIVAPSSTGAWAGHGGKIAAWQDGGWIFYAPREGWLCWCAAENQVLVHTGGSWDALVDHPGMIDDFTHIGVNTNADATNRLSVKAHGTLLSHDGASHRLTINKNAGADTASLVLQKGWSGRAEIGLTGNDNLSVRTSADGSSFVDAISIDAATGKVTFPHTGVLTDFAVNLYQDSGRFAGSAVSTVTVGAFSFPSYVSLYNSSAVAGLAKFIHNNNDYGGAAGALNADVKALIDKIRDPGYRRYGVEFWVAQITQGAGTLAPLVEAGQTYYYSAYSAQKPRAPRMTFHAYLKALDQNILVSSSSGLSMFKNGVAQTGNVVIAPGDNWVSLLIHDAVNPRTSVGYGSTLNVYAKASGNRWLLACPALVGGITPIDVDTGIIAANNLWPV